MLGQELARLVARIANALAAAEKEVVKQDDRGLARGSSTGRVRHAHEHVPVRRASGCSQSKKDQGGAGRCTQIQP